MQGKIVLITGGTGGIGRQTAIGLARLGAHVIVNGRDPARAEAGVASIRAASGSSRVEMVLGDVGEQADVRRMAAEVQARFPRLDVLINNAGLIPSSYRRTGDGLESGFAVNVVAPYLLTTLLLGRLQASRPARVINLAGGVPFGRIDLDNLQSQKGFTVFNAYSATKRALLALSLAYARRLEGTGVTLNVAYPGRADTPMTQGMQAPPALNFLNVLAKRVLPHGEETVIKAARGSIHLASSPAVEHLNGAYFNPDATPASWPRAARDEATQEALWALMGVVTAATAQAAHT